MFEFHWTDDSEAHIARHSVAPEEVEQAAERPFYTTPGREGTHLAPRPDPLRTLLTSCPVRIR